VIDRFDHNKTGTSVYIRGDSSNIGFMAVHELVSKLMEDSIKWGKIGVKGDGGEFDSVNVGFDLMEIHAIPFEFGHKDSEAERARHWREGGGNGWKRMEEWS
jgi:acid stress-induced BolA-like protein IbaG/YrbA